MNTLYNGLMHHPDFKKLDFSKLKISNGGGMAVQRPVAEQWKQITGCSIAEGYGLSETSPTLTCNTATSSEFNGSIGIPVPSTYISIRDDDGKEVALGQAGEICAKGPQVMSGYWNRPDETAKVMTADGYFRTGDIGVMDADGYTKIVDRKKDMILVSGFNVYPNEIEEVLAGHPGVLECAVDRRARCEVGRGGQGLRGQEGLQPHRRRHHQILPARSSPTTRCRSRSSSGPICPRPMSERSCAVSSATRRRPRLEALNVSFVIPGWSEGPDPESRDSGFALRAPRNDRRLGIKPR